jgi:hypothetical protein
MCSISLQSLGLIMPGPRKPSKIVTRRNADRRVACALQASGFGRAIDVGGLAMKVYRQGSNLYAVHEPATYAQRLPVHTPASRVFPRPNSA